jgi:hypothetical protein
MGISHPSAGSLRDFIADLAIIEIMNHLVSDKFEITEDV